MLKALSDIETLTFSNLIVFNEVQFENDSWAINETPLGIVISSNVVQLSNAFIYKFLILSERFISFKAVHSEKVYILMSLTLLGILTDVNEQPCKACSPISFTLLGILIDVNDVQ